MMHTRDSSVYDNRAATVDDLNDYQASALLMAALEAGSQWNSCCTAKLLSRRPPFHQRYPKLAYIVVVATRTRIN